MKATNYHDVSNSGQPSLKGTLICVLCLSFFPLFYLIGRLVMYLLS